MGGLLRGLSLRRKLTLLNVISSGGALLLAGLAYGLLEEHAARNALVRELGLQADFLALELGPAAGFGDATSLEAMLRRGIELPDLVGGRVFGPGGRTLALVGEAPSTLSETGHRFVPGGLEISRPIVSDGEIVAWLAVQSDLASLQPRRVTLIQNGVAVLFLAMLVSYLVSLFLQKQLTRRTEALADAVMRVSEGEGYAVRVTDHENDEIGKFIRAFNGMLEQIEARDAALREAHDHLELHVEERTHALKEEIARRAEVEEELIRSRDTAEAASRAKAEFVANMSHEIRTPLIGVIGMADLLADTELDDDQRDFTDTLRRSGGHLLTLVNDILDYSRIEENRIELEHVRFDVHDLVYDVAELLGVQATEKGVQMLVNVHESTPRHVHGDPARLRQVLTNLVGNGIKFTEAGYVLLTAEPVEGQSIRFQVTDSGIGIPREKFDSIFDKFTQADASTTRRFGGSGLGLAISSRLTQLMGGRIEVESTVGEGSRFSLALPLHGPTPPSTEGVLRGVRALAVLDCPMSLSILQGRLQHLGVETHAATWDEVREAKGAQAREVDVILADPCQTPAAEEPFHQLRAAKRDDARLVLLGTVGNTGAIRELRPMADLFLVRPLRPETLTQHLRGLKKPERVLT